jgi:hypothetical protein
MGGSPLANFPVMIRFMGATADLNLRTFAYGGHVENSNGYDIIFTSDQAGLTQLNHQIESYNPVTGEYVAWVRIPSLSNSVNTSIYMYYGNCAISVNPSTTGVWNSDFDAVYPLHNDFNDATVNGRTGTNTGSTDLSPALIGDGQTFGMNDYVQVPSSSISIAKGTLSIWCYASSFSGTQYMFGHTSVPNNWLDRIQLYVDNTNVGGLNLGFGDTHALEQNIVTLAPNVWNYVVLSWNGTMCSVYVNGVLEHTEGYTGFGTLQSYLDIGNDGRATAGRNEGWKGGLDHARLSNEIFNGNWIQTEYNNQRTGSTFYTVGAELSIVRTFYSRATGAWESNLSWSFASDGSSGAVPVGVLPRRADNVVIQSGHTITINNTTDNGSCPVSPDGLGRSNVGAGGGAGFNGSNLAMFYQTGDIIISGRLNVISGVNMMVEGYTYITSTGIFDLSSYLVNLGYLLADASSTLSTLDDLSLTGNSTTIINTSVTSADDLNIDFTNATLCGTGTSTLLNSAGSAINYTNGATLNQICTSFVVNCMGAGCAGFPVVGTNPVILGNTGPGGVGGTNGTTALVTWLDSNRGITTSGTAVTTWNDQSGYANHATQGTPANRPVLTSNALNGSPIVQFDGNNDVLSIADQNSIDLTKWSFLLVAKVTTHKNFNAFFVKGNDATENYEFLTNFPSTGNIHFPVYYTNGQRSSDAESVAGPSMSNSSFGVFQYDYDNVNTKMFKNTVQLLTRAETRIPQVNALPLLIGNEGGTAGRNLSGDIAEFASYNSKLNLSQQIITNNYLSAKYAIAFSSNDVYTMDDLANGNFDFDVAGIGQASDGSNHKDAQGSGFVRMWNPSNLGNGEFLIWGRNSLNFSGGNTNVDNTIIKERLNRVWRVSEAAGDVGTVSISVNMTTTLGMAIGSNLRLLIDRDGDGFADNDVTPVAGSFSGGIITFSGINFQNGDRFTIGNTDLAKPLPIELISFTAVAQQAEVKLAWSTASELNNDSFTVQRSQDAEQWQDVIKVKGAINSNERIDYETLDGLPFTGVSYYRLKQTDLDGQYSYSSVRRVEITALFQLKVYPNPSSGKFTISAGFELQPENIKLYNAIGQEMPVTLDKSSGSTILNTNIPKGIYILHVHRGNWRQSTRVVIE